MHRPHRPSRAPLALALALACAVRAPAQDESSGPLEDFALASDRAAAVDRMLPGTEDASWFRCLQLQLDGRLDEVDAVLAAWRKRLGESDRVREIERRQALLRFPSDPATTYAYLVDALGARFDHRREVPGEVPDLPTSLDPTLVSRDTLVRSVLRAGGEPLSRARDRALPALANEALDAAQLRALLQRLDPADVPNLPALVVRDLETKDSRGFGSLGVHSRLFLAQLEECARLRPALLGDDDFVRQVVRRLRPADGIDWRRDARAREAYLDRLLSWAQRLPPSQDAFEAHVLYHRLDHDRRRGVYDRERFLAYLRLPRQSTWINPKRLDDARREGRATIDLARIFETGFPPVRDEGALVEDFLAHVFLTEDDPGPWAELLDRDRVERVLAETKILNGMGDAERWYALLDDPAAYERIEQRVELDFALTQPERFAVDEPVVLEVDVKNVPTLLLKVFEVDTFNVYSETGKPVDASLALDGLVAHDERVFTYDEPPARRVRRRFELPGLDRPGVWVVELVGNGRSSRAVVRKGALAFTERRSAAGHALRAFDELGRPAPDATLWMGGLEYRPEAGGEIVVPYSSAPASRTVVLRRGDFADLAQLEIAGETYALEAPALVERESLAAGRSAIFVVRPLLRLDGVPVSLALLERPVLHLVSTDLDGVDSTLAVPVEPRDGADVVHELVVPDDLQRIEVSLTATVRRLVDGAEVALASPSSTFAVNGIDETPRTAQRLLTRTSEGWALDVLGKNGEPKADQAVRLRLQPRDFTDPIDVALKTDARGRVRLGTLDEIASLGCLDDDGSDAWTLRPRDVERPVWLHGVAGRPLQVALPPVDGRMPKLDRALASLVEMRDEAPYADRFEHLALVDGALELRGLPPGSYTLTLQGTDARVTVAAGDVHDGWVFGPARALELTPAPLTITSAALERDALVVRLDRAGPDTRVLVTTSRWTPAFEAFERLPTDLLRPGARDWPAADSLYESGRTLGDEYRYILERRFRSVFAGNMLRRPSLLLAPWALEEVDTWNDTIGVGGGAGGAFASKTGRRGQAADRAGMAVSQPSAAPHAYADLGFLDAPGALVAELRPDKNGVVRVPRASLGGGHLVRVVALDELETVATSLVLPEPPLARRDLRLLPGLDPARPVAGQRSLAVLDPGESVVIEDATTAQVALHDSLDAAFRLLQAVSGQAALAEWSFLLDWPTLPRERRLELYGRYACHELHLFLHEKDPAFFDEVVRPYLANALHRTFLDSWLLDDDLSRYLAPSEYAGLNVVERALLARRMPVATGGIVRELRDAWDLVPPDPERERFLFDAALHGGALAGGGALGEMLRGVRDEETLALRQLGYVAAPAPAAEEEAIDAAFDAGQANESGMLAGRGVRRSEDAARRGAVRARWREVDATKAWVENEYWHVRRADADASLVPVNAFWVDLADAAGGRPFVSANLLQATSSLNEALLALAVLDLPFEAEPLEPIRDGRRITVRTAGPALVAIEQLAPAEPEADAAPLLVSQGLFRIGDRYAWDGNRRVDRFVRDEFLVDVAYGSQVVLTNPTLSPRRLELLLQIPRGALPLAGSRATRTLEVELDPFGTRTVENAFYFPQAGEQRMFPALASHDGRLVAAAEPRTLRVVATPSTVDTRSWAHVSQQGSTAEVLAFLDTNNVRRLDLSRLAWRMRDRAAFGEILGALRKRHVFSRPLWTYGLLHGDPTAVRELLENDDDFVRGVGPILHAPLLSVDALASGELEHVEFEPLVNARAHPFGGQRRIASDDALAAWRRLLSALAYRPRLTDADWLAVTYHLLLQDRVEDALEAFGRVDPTKVATRVQYDYARAYLDFFRDDPSLARAVAEPYRDHPVPRWRERFGDVLAQLDEAAGGPVAPGTPGDRTGALTALAAGEPSLELELSGGRITLVHDNLATCELRFYAMDVELLFSSNPFVQQGVSAFSSIRPNRVETVALPADGAPVTLDLPEAFRSRNVLVEVRGGGVVRRVPSYSNALDVRTFETYGQLQVRDAASGQPLPKAYVKVYVRTQGGGVRFHKDGYTDLRGRFDYASLSGDPGDAASFAVLVLTDERGAVVREVAPPPR